MEEAVIQGLWRLARQLGPSIGEAEFQRAISGYERVELKCSYSCGCYSVGLVLDGFFYVNIGYFCSRESFDELKTRVTRWLTKRKEDSNGTEVG